MQERQSDNKPPGALRTVAVIDIGTHSIRANIAQIDSEGRIVPVDRLSKPVNLGRDAFTRSVISNDTISETVGILKGFKDVLNEWAVASPDQIHAVATSAVREASNRESFVDRVYMATGIEASRPLDAPGLWPASGVFCACRIVPDDAEC